MKVYTATTSNPSHPAGSITTVHFTEGDAHEVVRSQVEGYAKTGDVSDAELVDVVQSEGILFVDISEHDLFTLAETGYLARAVDLGRSDPQASSLLAPDERGILVRKLGGRRD